ncbi:MAG: LacI family DNA-binding transcriptional regulator [Vallitaleaceae bacterium]|nr:LacI family DNA-binding transcriptional regulator [Vallitaleaceae bacterium]
MPNIYDVAREAGVSRSTVSRVINHQKSVIESKRIRVLEAIEKLNYTPNATARALAMNKTNTIGVIARELTEDFYAGFINNIHRFADEHHYGILFCMRKTNSRYNIDYIDFLHKKVDGFIFLGENTVTEEELRKLATAKTPVVVLEMNYPIQPITYINVNNEAAAYTSVMKLQNKHRCIAHITASENTQEKEMRIRGFEKAIQDAGVLHGGIYHLPYYMVNARLMIDAMIDEFLEKGVSAAFCFNNAMATVLAEGLIKRKIKIPEEFAIIGFDDINYASQAILPVPRISSNRQPQYEMAEYAITALVKSIDELHEEKEMKEDYSRVFSCEFVQGESS